MREILVMSRAAPKSSRICPKKRGDCTPWGDRLSGVQVVLECVYCPSAPSAIGIWATLRDTLAKTERP
jgi:hypothetical protein